MKVTLVAASIAVFAVIALSLALLRGLTPDDQKDPASSSNAALKPGAIALDTHAETPPEAPSTSPQPTLPIEEARNEAGLEDPGAVQYMRAIRKVTREGNLAFARDLLVTMKALYPHSILVDEAETLIAEHNS